MKINWFNNRHKINNYCNSTELHKRQKDGKIEILNGAGGEISTPIYQ